MCRLVPDVEARVVKERAHPCTLRFGTAQAAVEAVDALWWLHVWRCACVCIRDEKKIASSLYPVAADMVRECTVTATSSTIHDRLSMCERGFRNPLVVAIRTPRALRAVVFPFAPWCRRARPRGVLLRFGALHAVRVISRGRRCLSRPGRHRRSTHTPCACHNI